MRTPVDRRARVLPGPEHRIDRAAELLAWIVGDHATVLTGEAPELDDERAEIVDAEVGVERDAAIRLLARQRVLEHVAGNAFDDLAEHLQETPVRVPREPLVARLQCQRRHGSIAHAEVEDRVHHPRHREHGARAHRYEERSVAAAEHATGPVLELVEPVGDVAPEAVRPGAVAAHRLDAGLGRDRETVRYRDADAGHLRNVRALAAQQGAHLGRALCKVVHVLRHGREHSPAPCCGLVSGRADPVETESLRPARLEPILPAPSRRAAVVCDRYPVDRQEARCSRS